MKILLGVVALSLASALAGPTQVTALVSSIGTLTNPTPRYENNILSWNIKVLTKNDSIRYVDLIAYPVKDKKYTRLAGLSFDVGPTDALLAYSLPYDLGDIAYKCMNSSATVEGVTLSFGLPIK